MLWTCLFLSALCPARVWIGSLSHSCHLVKHRSDCSLTFWAIGWIQLWHAWGRTTRLISSSSSNSLPGSGLTETRSTNSVKYSSSLFCQAFSLRSFNHRSFSPSPSTTIHSRTRNVAFCRPVCSWDWVLGNIEWLLQNWAWYVQKKTPLHTYPNTSPWKRSC